MANSIVFQEEWEIKLQERLKFPTNWKEVCKVDYTNTKVLHNPYIAVASEPAVQTGTRGSVYSFQDVTETDESISIDTYEELALYVDDADEAQSNYAKQMDLADLQGQKINERLEAAMLGQHAQWTNFDNASIGGSAGNITVTATNIDDIIRGLRREIYEANGNEAMQANGMFIVWRPADLEALEAFGQANGFTFADKWLKDGAEPGVYYMGAWHYMSNSHTAGHLFAGVRKRFHMGIVKATYGKITKVVHPAGASGGNLSGTGMHTRVDYKFKSWTKESTPLLFDVLVA